MGKIRGGFMAWSAWALARAWPQTFFVWEKTGKNGQSGQHREIFFSTPTFIFLPQHILIYPHSTLILV
jgi:hypothetical protein